jgi:aryl-alcohol dehydrogenase-like predicted oxidoreductase
MSYGDPSWRGWSWVKDEAESRPFLKRALDLGINFFDTADVYGRGNAERILGATLNDIASRDEVVIASKVYMPMAPTPNFSGLGRKHILSSIDATLKRLGTDHVDLYQIHRFDPNTPIEETLETLDLIVKAGKVRYIGACSMFAWQLMKMLGVSDRRALERFVSMQNHYNLLYREEEREMMPLCKAEGIGVMPWSPLARGRLTRAWDETTNRIRTDQYGSKLYVSEVDADRRVIEAVAAVAADRGVSKAQVALAWISQKPYVTAPIIGASKPQHLTDAVAALSLQLDEAEISALEASYVPHPIVGHS